MAPPAPKILARERMIGDMLRHALSLHRAGRLSEAAGQCEGILHLAGDHAGTLQLLGVIRAGQSDFTAAAEILRKVIALAPKSAEAHNNLGLVLKQSEQVDEAIATLETAVSLKPDYAIAYNNLGMALAAKGRFDEAVQQYRRALALEPRYHNALNNLGRALYAQDRPAEGIECLEKAIALKPDFAEAHLNIAQALSALGRRRKAVVHYRRAAAYEPKSAEMQFGVAEGLLAASRHAEAIDYFKKAIALDPKRMSGRAGLGTALQEIGRLDEARAEFDTVIETEPRGPKNYMRLVNITKLAGDDPRVSALAALESELPSMSIPDQIAFHFARGKALADVGENERSFDHFLAGNALVRGVGAYNEASVLGRLERTRSIVTRELIESRKADNPSSLPIFILGMPRSGSSLVEQILAKHPSVHAAGELEELRASLHSAAGAGSDEFPDDLPKLGDDQLDAIAADYLARITDLASLDESSTPPLRITDKMPANFRYVGLIHMVLPNARIIHTCRDPLDTCLSCFSIHFQNQPFANDLGELGRYYRAYARLMDHWRAVLPRDTMLDVPYEEVVADFETWARRIVAHCGLAWDDACLTFTDAARPVRTASAEQVRRPIYRTSVGRWRPPDEKIRPMLDALNGLKQ